MANCGCNQTGSGCGDPKDRKFFIAEVEESNAATCAEQAQCPFNNPFYDTTLPNNGFVIASVGSAFIVKVCDNSRWAEGQWVYIPNAGRFQIIAKDGCNSLYLRNGCGTGSNAEAIPGNSNPGKSFNGVQHLWLTADPGCGGDANSEFCNNVLDAIAECDQDLCKYLEPVGSEDNYYRLLAGTHQDDEEGTISCFRKAFDILVTPITLCFPRMASNTVTSNGDGSVQDVQIMPLKGCLVKRALPANPSIDIYCEGKKQYLRVPSDWEDKNYILGVDEDGCPGFVEQIEFCDIAQTRHNKTKTSLKSVSGLSFAGANLTQDVNLATWLGTIPACSGPTISVELFIRFSADNTTSSSVSARLDVVQNSSDFTLNTQSSDALANTGAFSVILDVPKATPILNFKVARYAGSGGTFSLDITGFAVYY
jgi:hypothetical protein